MEEYKISGHGSGSTSRQDCKDHPPKATQHVKAPSIPNDQGACEGLHYVVEYNSMDADGVSAARIQAIDFTRQSEKGAHSRLEVPKHPIGAQIEEEL